MQKAFSHRSNFNPQVPKNDYSTLLIKKLELKNERVSSNVPILPFTLHNRKTIKRQCGPHPTLLLAQPKDDKEKNVFPSSPFPCTLIVWKVDTCRNAVAKIANRPGDCNSWMTILYKKKKQELFVHRV